MSHPPTLSALRRRADRQGLRIIKYREGSRWYAQHGPYAIVDAATNTIIGSRIADEAELSEELAEARRMAQEG